MTTINTVFSTAVVTIASSGTVSGALDLQADKSSSVVVGIIMPAAFTGSTISFQISDDGVTYYALYNANNTLVSMSVTQGRAYGVVPGDLVSARYIKLVSGSTESGSRDIKLITRVLA